MYKLVVFFILLFVLVRAVAQENNTANPDTTYKGNILEEVEVRAMYSSIASQRFPASVYTTEGYSNDILLPLNINASFNKLPSVYAHSGTFNTSRITMRGIGTRSLYGTRKINALINDIPLTSGEGDTFIDDIDFQLISRVEVIGGPTAGIYGPALGGTILLSTVNNSSNLVSIGGGIGSFGTIQGYVMGYLKNKNSRLAVVYKNVKSDGYRQNNNYWRQSAMINYGTDFKKSTFDVTALYTAVKSGIPSSIDSLTFEQNPKAAAPTWLKTNGKEDSRRFLAGVSHKYTHSSSLNSTVTIYGVLKEANETRPFDLLKENDIIGGVKLDMKYKLDKVPGLSFTPGLSFYWERYSSSLFENVDGIGVQGDKFSESSIRSYQANGFLITNYIPDLKNYFTVSLNVNRTLVSVENPIMDIKEQKYKQQLYFSPRLSYSRKILSNHFVFGSLSHGLSYPSVQEFLYPDGTVNNNVKPEQAWSLEGGFKGVNLFNEIRYSLALYYMPVINLIVPERIAEDTYVGKNVGKSLHTGLEIFIERGEVSSKSLWFYLADYKLSFNWQQNKFKKFYSDTQSLKNNILPGVPGKRLFVSLLFKIKRSLFIEPELFINGKMAMNDENTRFYHNYLLLNFKYGYSVVQNKWNIKMWSSVNNVFDRKYASMILINAPSVNNKPRYYYPGLPRNFNLSVSVGYSI
jgi:iron complex outermembrane receptor protein